MQYAFLSVDADLIGQLRNVKLDDVAGHTRLVIALQIADAVRKQLWLLIQDGAAASEQINLRGRRID